MYFLELVSHFDSNFIDIFSLGSNLNIASGNGFLQNKQLAIIWTT